MNQMKPSDVMFTLVVVPFFALMWEIIKLIISTVCSFAVFFVEGVYEEFGDDFWEIPGAFIAIITTAFGVLFESVKSKKKVL